ncbi:hypothetical protein BaRGS_00007716 [Batillaria attramentaria]|uniref:Uncharacterized protein n=1 Tax=Batillaria attramentaria TaxID=370345 RepID=A0ABD0LPQ4_9CAEN
MKVDRVSSSWRPPQKYEVFISIFFREHESRSCFQFLEDPTEVRGVHFLGNMKVDRVSSAWRPPQKYEVFISIFFREHESRSCFQFLEDPTEVRGVHFHIL